MAQLRLVGRTASSAQPSPLASAAFTYLATTPFEIDSARAMRSCDSAQSYLSRNSSLILCMAIRSADIPSLRAKAREGSRNKGCCHAWPAPTIPI
jgi:hypothetical protein